MPTVVREDGFVVKVWGPPREHAPPHVHVEKPPDGLITIRLALPKNRQRVWEYYNVSKRDILKAFRIVEKHEDAIRREWERLHGKATA